MAKSRQRPPQRIVMLGCGTGVGKTHVSVALAEALRAADNAAPVIALKPIETGLSRARLDAPPPAGSDAAALEAASSPQCPVRPHPLYAFVDPISAHLAARRERRRIELARVRSWLRAAPDQALRDTTLRGITRILIETAGGVFSPLSGQLTNRDLALACDPSIWVLVVPDALGVLHDTRATLLALASTGRSPDFVVVNGARPPDASTGTNAAELPRVGLPRPIAVVPRDGNAVRALAPLVRAIANWKR
jgi:dethiobiotin synthetase